MQCVILAGGLGTRMRPLTDTCPKTLLPVAGKPFAWHQLSWLAQNGVTEVVYSIGHQGEQIRSYWESVESPVASLRFVDEGEQLRGTGGALRLALDHGVLDEAFFVLYGDSFLPVPLEPIWSRFASSDNPALMTVLRNEGRWDTSNVVFEDGCIALYDKRARRPDMLYIDYGLSALRRSLIESVPETVFDLSSLFHNLSREGRLGGYEVHRRFYEIGSPEGLLELEQFLRESADLWSGVPLNVPARFTR